MSYQNEFRQLVTIAFSYKCFPERASELTKSQDKLSQMAEGSGSYAVFRDVVAGIPSPIEHASLRKFFDRLIRLSADECDVLSIVADQTHSTRTQTTLLWIYRRTRFGRRDVRLEHASNGKRRVSAAIKGLENAGLLRVYRGGNEGSQYQLILPSGGESPVSSQPSVPAYRGFIACVSGVIHIVRKMLSI